MRFTLLLATMFATLVATAVWADMKAATKRSKTGDFDTTAEIRCAQEVGEALNPL